MRIQTSKDIGAMVRDTRRRRGLTQQALADLVGVARRWVTALEAGKSGAELGLVLATFNALGLRVDVMDAKAPQGTDTEPPTVPSPTSIDLDAVLSRLDENR